MWEGIKSCFRGNGKLLKDGMGCNNPILCQILGICSALAVTGFVNTTVVMCIALIFVTSCSSMLYSFVRNITPMRVRMMAQMVIVSMLVIVVHLFLQAYWYEMSKALGPYVGLIITNCIVMGRCEAYAIRNPPWRSFLDGIGNASGYSLVLLAMSFIREPLGHGTLLGFRVLPETFIDVQLVSLAPGAFLTMSVIVWIVRAIKPEPQNAQHPEAH